MLKKRILASSMASVMALSGVSVAAFAEDTKAEVKGAVVDKTELKSFVDSLANFMEDDINNYGSVQGDKIQAAYDHALRVLEGEATDMECTAAYYMLKKLYDGKQQKSNQDLQDLLDKYESIYTGNNYLNGEDSEDLKYDETDYSNFVDKYETAQSYIGTEDTRGITDAYYELEDAKDDLTELDIVKKGEFLDVYTKYQDLLFDMKQAESWRRGALTVAPSDYNIKNVKDWVVTLADAIDIVYGTSRATLVNYDDITADSKQKTWINVDNFEWVQVDAVDEGGNPIKVYNLKASIAKQYDEFINIKAVPITSNEKIVAAYEAAKVAIDIFNGWKQDANKSGSKQKAANDLKKYHNQLVELYRYYDIEQILGKSVELNQYNGERKETKSDAKKLKAEGDPVTFTYNPEKHTLTADKAIDVVIDEEDDFIYEGTNNNFRNNFYIKDSTKLNIDALKTSSGVETLAKKSIPAKTNILTFIDYNDIPAHTTDVLKQAYATKQTALKDAYDTAVAQNKLLVNPVAGTAAADAGDGVKLATSGHSFLEEGTYIPAFEPTQDEWDALGITAFTKEELKLLKPDTGANQTNIDAIKAHNAQVLKIAALIDDGTTEGSTKGAVATFLADKETKGGEAKDAYETGAGTKAGSSVAFLKNDIDGSAKKTVASADYSKLTELTGDDAITITSTDADAGDLIKLLKTDATASTATFSKVEETDGENDPSGYGDAVGAHNTAVGNLIDAIEAYKKVYTDLDTALTDTELGYDASKLIAASAYATNKATPAGETDDDTYTFDSEDPANANLLLSYETQELETAQAFNEEATASTKYTFELVAIDTAATTPATQTAVNDHNTAVKDIIAKAKELDELLNPVAAADRYEPGNVDHTDPTRKGDYETTHLKYAIEDLYEVYLDFEFPDDEAAAKAIMGTDDAPGLADGKTIKTISGGTPEWTIIWRYLHYALQDRFPAAEADAKHTMQDLYNLITKDAVEALKQTVDSSLFEKPNKELAEQRDEALDWYKDKKATTGYKPDDELEAVYDALKTKIKDLNDMFAKFKYSYDQIREEMYKAAKAMDDGEITEKTDELTKAIEECAVALSVLEPSDYSTDITADSNKAFSDDRVFQPANRLRTKDGSSSEKDLAKKLDALKDAYDAALKASTTPADKSDLDGSGVVDKLDVVELIKAVAAGSTDLKYDIDGDTKVNKNDTIMLLKAVLFKA